MERILIVEDDVHIAKVISTTLMIGGYQGEICGNGREALDLIDSNDYDLILLDVMLPDMDGFTIMKLRQNKKSPVIFLTAMQEVTDKVRGLKLGAEDYIVKPFEAMELLARIEVVLRRGKKSENIMEFQDIQIRLDQHSVTKAGEPVSLTPKEFELLIFFLENQNVALTRERILASVWGYEFAGETRTVDIHVQQLRKKLGIKSRLVTIPKIGYRLESIF